MSRSFFFLFFLLHFFFFIFFSSSSKKINSFMYRRFSSNVQALFFFRRFFFLCTGAFFSFFSFHFCTAGTAEWKSSKPRPWHISNNPSAISSTLCNGKLTRNTLVLWVLLLSLYWKSEKKINIVLFFLFSPPFRQLPDPWRCRRRAIWTVLRHVEYAWLRWCLWWSWGCCRWPDASE